jgi:NAD(P)-dependent dehydrogenase (short-subunit alcohol dehydrogenase family)
MKMFEGKCAIVTGAGQGIGRAVAKGLAEQGANVVVAELNDANGSRVAEEINKAGGKSLAVATDVSSEESVNAMVAETLRAFTQVDILVNNAAILPASSVADMRVDEWVQVLQINLNGTFYCCRAVMPGMKRQKKGRIVNFTSGRALQGSKDGRSLCGVQRGYHRFYEVARTGAGALRDYREQCVPGDHRYCSDESPREIRRGILCQGEKYSGRQGRPTGRSCGSGAFSSQ